MDKKLEKILQKLKAGDIIWFKWLDAVSDPKWLSPEAAKTKSLCECISCGFFLNYDNQALRIFTSITPDGEKDVTVVPVREIVELHVIKKVDER